MASEVAEVERGARYVAIITDGNGRWAQQRGLPVIAGPRGGRGHRQGAAAGRGGARNRGADGVLVLDRELEPLAEEVSALMAMMGRRIERETPELHDEGVRMRFIGRRFDPVPETLVERMAWAEELTAGNTRITLFVAFNYGGRAEIVDAARTFTGGTKPNFAPTSTRPTCTTQT